MRTDKLSKKYARMFLNHLDGKDPLKALEELASVRLIAERDESVKGFLAGPQFSPEEKNAFLDSLSGKLNFSEATRKFLSFLVESEAMGRLPEITGAAVALYMERAKKAKAQVFSAIEPGAAELARLKTALGKMIEKEVEIEYVKDPAVIGGLLVKVGSTMFDGSLRGQLRMLKEELIKG